MIQLAFLLSLAGPSWMFGLSPCERAVRNLHEISFFESPSLVIQERMKTWDEKKSNLPVGFLVVEFNGIQKIFYWSYMMESRDHPKAISIISDIKPWRKKKDQIRFLFGGTIIMNAKLIEKDQISAEIQGMGPSNHPELFAHPQFEPDLLKILVQSLLSDPQIRFNQENEFEIVLGKLEDGPVVNGRRQMPRASLASLR